MAKDDNKQLIRRVVEECWNTGNAELADELYSPDFVFHTEGDGEMRSPESIKQWIRILRGAIPDLTYEIGALYCEDDRVAMRYKVRGTHQGEFQGIAPTGAKLDLTGHMVFHVQDGKIGAAWGYWDTLGLMIALGLVPPLGGGPPRHTENGSGPAAHLETVRRFFEAANNDDFDTFNEIMIPDFITHGDALFPFVRGRDILKVALPAFKAAFPDAKITPEVMFEEGDKVVAHVNVTGTHKGAWLGAEPTGKHMKWSASTIIRFNRDGKMAERWVIEDELGVAEQLGVAPRIGAGAPSESEG